METVFGVQEIDLIKLKFLALLLFFSGYLIAQDGILKSGCLPSTSESELNINNVRTTILGGGDMWWNLNDGRYEIPKGSGKHSMFAGSIWVGGLDDTGNLKVASMTYRQDGNDFWPGPLNGNEGSNNYGTTNPSVCNEFDRHWSILKSDVIEYKNYLDCLNDENCDENISFANYFVPEAIENWPGSYNNSDGELAYLAPFHDEDGDGQYTYGVDYPEYNIDGELGCNDNILFGDQSIWWVFNDNGNTHTESGSESAIGLEIQAQAFAFDYGFPLNNTTFYNYKIINRSTTQLNNTYFGMWIDPDLGNYQDDYVGCDVGLGLGYCYNGDADDDGTSGYNYDSDDPPPAIGVDFFRGPLADIGDGVDNDRDGEIDEPGEQIIMSKFIYYNNDFSDFGNPENAAHYYGYLRGIWKNGQPMTYGGTGWESSNPGCNFMFPGDTDPSFTEEWTEITAGNDPADRRFLQSAGPFTLEPGAVNYITTGVVWARASQGNNFTSVELLKQADQFAQDLFDACFNSSQVDPVFVGCTNTDALNYNPDAVYDDGSCLVEGCTDVEACNFDYLANIDNLSCKYCFFNNNFPLTAVFKNDEELISSNIGDGYIKWYGESSVICDNDFDGILNDEDSDIDGNGIIDDIDSDGILNGIDNDIDGDGILNFDDDSLEINNNIFSIYDFNSFETESQLNFNFQCRSIGDTCPENLEFIIENLDFEELSSFSNNPTNSWIKPLKDIDRIISFGSNEIDIYQDYYANFLRPQNWIKSGKELFSTNNVTTSLIHKYGDLGVSGQAMDSGDTPLDPKEIFEFDQKGWLVPYKLLNSNFRGQTWSSTTSNEINSIDTIGGGFAYKDFKNQTSLDSLFNVDVVLTPDHSLWTRCPVLDMSEQNITWEGIGPPIESNLYQSNDWSSGSQYGSWNVGSGSGENGEEKWDIRLDLNVDKDGSPDGTGYGFNHENGWSWFPGYAVNSDTGVRLNLMFSENSSLGETHNANDMLFNPTEFIYDFGLDNNFFQSASQTTMNGGHILFILNTEYQGDNIEDNPLFESYTSFNLMSRKREVIKHIQWAGLWLANSASDWLSEPIRIQTRIRGISSDSILNENCECVCIGFDSDGDFVCDDDDNCIYTYNPEQNDSDNDGIGDECDPNPFPDNSSTSEFYLEKELLRSFDIIGKSFHNKNYKIEIFDDGTVNKKYILKK